MVAPLVSRHSSAGDDVEVTREKLLGGENDRPRDRGEDDRCEVGDDVLERPPRCSSTRDSPWTGFTRADGIASLIIAAIMLRAAYGLLKDSGQVLLEIAPEEMDGGLPAGCEIDGDAGERDAPAEGKAILIGGETRRRIPL